MPFDLDAVNQTVDKMKEAYSNQAYIMFRAEKKFDVHEEGGIKKVDTTLKLDEGEPYTIRKIEFEGNTKTKDKVLRRCMLMQGGGPLPRRTVQGLASPSISQLGFFDVKSSEPKVDLVPGQAPGGCGDPGRRDRRERGAVPGWLRIPVRVLPGGELLHPEPGWRR